MKSPGSVTGCVNPWHTHTVDVMANIAKMQRCTFVDPPDTIAVVVSLREAQGIVDDIRRLGVPGYRLEGLMLKLVKLLDFSPKT